MAYLGSGWRGKKVQVYFNAGGSFSGMIREHSDGGLVLEVEEDQGDEGPRVMFIPWGSAKLIEALEEVKKESNKVRLR